MKRILYMIIGVTLLLTSCDKVDSANGNLDGFWQMTMILNKVDATNSDMRLSGITWAFQGHILELRDVNKVNQDIIMSFNHDGNKLKLYEPYRVDRDSNDIIINDVAFLLPYGIESTTVEYNVIELSNSCMILDNNVWNGHRTQY